MNEGDCSIKSSDDLADDLLAKHICQLLDICLEHLKPVLSDALREKGLSAQVYAFPSVLTFSACTPPLSEVLRIWDVLLAYGVHLNILCIVAQLSLMENDLLDSQK